MVFLFAALKRVGVTVFMHYTFASNIDANTDESSNKKLFIDEPKKYNFSNDADRFRATP